MRIILAISMVLFSWIGYAQNLIKDGGFEHQHLYENNQLARIASFGDLGASTQIVNPKMDCAEEVKSGVWYKKASNSGYIRATVTQSDSAEGAQSLLLGITRNSPQENLDKWETSAVLQYLPIEHDATYQIKLSMKNNIDCKRAFVGLVSGNGYEIEGSKWVDIDGEWREYSLTIEPNKHKTTGGYTKKLLQRGALVVGIGCEYDENGKSKQTSILIDKIEITKQ